jgi:ribosome recycling factor
MNEFGSMILDEARDKMDKAVAHYADELKSIRTGRASPALLDPVRVDYYGTPTPLIQLAQISVPEPRMLMIKPFDASVTGDIEKAIHKANLGLTPNSDGKLIRLALPPLSEEQRKKLVGTVKERAETSRVALRNIRRDLNKQVDEAQKSGDFTEDEQKQLHDKIQECLKDHEVKIDEILKKKSAEILDV